MTATMPTISMVSLSASDDPEYKNISLDMFDTDMIQNISVQKTLVPATEVMWVVR